MGLTSGLQAANWTSAAARGLPLLMLRDRRLACAEIPSYYGWLDEAKSRKKAEMAPTRRENAPR